MLKVLVLAVSLFAAPQMSSAMTKIEAQQCANKLLQSYNEREYPRRLLAVADIIQRAYGPAYRNLSSADKALADQIAIELLQSSFTKPTGRYRYTNLTVSEAVPTKSGYRVLGNVYITSPKYTGFASFTALLKGATCSIYQVRIADVAALDLELREMIKKDTRTSKFFNE